MVRLLPFCVSSDACRLTMELNSAHSHLSFSEDNKKMTRMETAQPYPDNPERFTDWGQVLCKEGLSARCYWEVEWTGEWTGAFVLAEILVAFSPQACSDYDFLLGSRGRRRSKTFSSEEADEHSTGQHNGPPH